MTTQSHRMVQTVLGPVPASDLGITLPHEHLYSDDRAWSTVDPESPDANRPVSIELLGRLTRDPDGVTIDNIHIDDHELIVEEAARYRQAGGRTLVDLTNEGCGANPAALPDIARRTGITIVAGCGYYIDSTHASELRASSVEQIADGLLAQITDGIGDTGVRPGIVGEIGTGSPITPSEERVLRASARAATQAGLGLSVHVHPWRREALAAIDVVRQEGTDLSRVAIDHLDQQLDIDYHLAIAESGVLMGFTGFGMEYYWDQYHYYAPTDRERVQHIVELARRGFLNQILISQDLAYKIRLVRYGGWGYGHILEHVVGMFRHYGFGEEEVNVLLVDNPRRLLAGA
jgi:phosphotriesterase-related protein